MFDQIVAALNENPYLGVALVFLLCGLGFPLPEEIVLLAAGYVSALEEALQSGDWDAKHGALRTRSEYDGSLRLVVSA